MNKEIILKNTKLNTLSIVLTNNVTAFEGFTESMEARDNFLAMKSRATVLISLLSKPYTEFYGVKSDSKDKLYSSLSLAIGTGISIATRQKNIPLLGVLKNYRATISRTTMHDLHEMADRVCTELEQYETQANAAGLTAEKLTALKDLTVNFREIIESTAYEVSTRKAERKELQMLISTIFVFLKDQMDPFVRQCKDSQPDFYNAYMTARFPKRRSRKKSGVSLTAELSGTVTNSVTGVPVANATIYVVELDMVVTTDADGYYLADELAAGTYTLLCSAPGYAAPAEISSPLLTGESLVFDFSLVPVIPATK